MELIDRQFLARSGRHEELRPLVSGRPGTRRQQQRGPARREDRLHGGGDVIEELGEVQVAYQRLGEFEEPASVLLAPVRLVAGRVKVVHDLGHDEHDDQVDEKGQRVGPGVNRQGTVRGQEKDVVQDDAGHRGHDARHESADHDAEYDGNHEDETGRGGAQMGAEGKHHGQQGALAEQGHQKAEESSPIRCAEGLHASHFVGHNFPGIGALGTECTEGTARTRHVRRR